MRFKGLSRNENNSLGSKPMNTKNEKHLELLLSSFISLNKVRSCEAGLKSRTLAYSLDYLKKHIKKEILAIKDDQYCLERLLMAYITIVSEITTKVETNHVIYDSKFFLERTINRILARQ